MPGTSSKKRRRYSIKRKRRWRIRGKVLRKRALYR